MKNKKINYSKISFWAGIIFFLISIGITIYSIFLYSPQPDLKAQILVNEELLTLNDELTGLKVYYNDIELDKHLNDITIYKLRLVNSGNESISINDFDPRFDWGIEILNSKIISDPIITNSSDSAYFNQNIIKSNNDSMIVFEKIILDPKDFFDIKFYVIGSLEKDINLNIFSKISKIKNIDIVESISETKNNSKSTYILILIFAFLVLIMSIYSIIRSSRDSKKYEKLMNKILELSYDNRNNNNKPNDSLDGSKYEDY